MIAFITDLHFTETTPAARRDEDYFAFQLERFEWCVDTALAKGAEALLIGGDVFDHYLGSVMMINSLSTIMSRIPCYTCLGNHDLMGRSVSNLDQSAIMCLDGKGLTIGSEEEPITIGKFVIHFIHWNTTKFSSFMNDEVLLKKEDKKDEEIHVCVAHLPVAAEDSEWSKGVKSLDTEGYDFVFVGDQHFGFKPYKTRHNTVIANPGAFAVSKSDEIDRIPSILFLDDSKKLTSMQIPQPHYSKVFKTRLIENKARTKREKTKGARVAIKNKEAGITGVDLIKQVAKELGYDKEIVDIVLGNM